MAKKRKPNPTPKPKSPAPPPEEPVAPPAAPAAEPVDDVDSALRRMSAAFAELWQGEEDAPAEPAAGAPPGEVAVPGPNVARSPQPAVTSTPRPESADAQTNVWSREAEPLQPAGEVTVEGILEAALFVGHPQKIPLTDEVLAGLMRGVDPSEIAPRIAAMNASYIARGKPYEIVEDDGGRRLSLRAEFGPVRSRFYGKLRTARLSQGAVEALAAVAYLQPTTADEVNKLRGSNSGPILSQLVRRDLLAVRRNPDEPRKPQYVTTARFLRLFQLDSLAELPKAHDIDDR